MMFWLDCNNTVLHVNKQIPYKIIDRFIGGCSRLLISQVLGQ